MVQAQKSAGVCFRRRFEFGGPDQGLQFPHERASWFALAASAAKIALVLFRFKLSRRNAFGQGAPWVIRDDEQLTQGSLPRIG
ncbi:hypothetical protein M2447_000903 [Ereboglobus sp. PH5-10]|uniref:hypothetical protein n=1 Tax=Ereboglobus sp. PH5-10 TaxID=2940629 RepID=UPI0024070EE6|nr:hypothetical protein [Ereboglobus sp. PH5-10]MDF9826818.1 hypothetical protein [Ereboglobus sp. PH5-10]